MNVHSLVPFISFASYCVLMGIALRNPQTKVRQLFALYLVAMMAWSFGALAAQSESLSSDVLFWSKVMTVAGLSMMVPYYHFIRAFGNKGGGIAVWVGYTLIGILALLAIGGWVVKDAFVEGGLLHLSWGAWSQAFIALTACYMAMAVFFLVQWYRSLTDPLARTRIVYLLVGIAMVAVFGGASLAPTVGKYPLEHIGGLINALIISHVILHHQLLDINLAARRGLAYLIWAICLIGIYSGALFLLETVIDVEASAVTVAAFLGGITLIGTALQPLRTMTRDWVERLFFRETYEYRKFLVGFTRRLSNVLDLGELAETMLQSVARAMRTSGAYLLLPDMESGDFIPQFVQPKTAAQSMAEVRFKKDNPIVTWLARGGKAMRRELIDTSPEFKSLPQQERDDLNALDAELLFPLRSKGKLVGILGVGRKRTKALYSQDEMDLLMTMATEAAIAIENAGILDNLKRQQLRVAQLLAETVQAQEEERKRVSVELHDSVAQWLVGASYTIQSIPHLLPEANGEQARRELAEIEKTIDQSIRELRRVMSDLHPPALEELGLVNALRQIVEKLGRDGITAHFQIQGVPPSLPPSIEISIYRIVQEALSNIRKHSGATEVEAWLEFGPESISVEVHDNGKGFDLPKTVASEVAVHHMGLMGMKQRAETFGGTLRIDTGPGKGTTISLTVPTDELRGDQR